MSARIYLYDRTGRLRTELGTGEFRLGPRSYCLSKIGDCHFAVPTSNPKCTEDNLGGGNLVKVVSTLGVPAWGGRIETATFNGAGEVEIKAESREVILKSMVIDWDLMPGVDDLMAAGPRIEQILQYKIQVGDLVGITIGEIYTGGDLLSFNAFGASIWDDVIPRLRADAWEKGTSGRQPECYVDADGAFHWLEQRGQDRRQSVLIRGGYHTSRKTARVVRDWARVISRGVAFGNAAGWEHKEKQSYTDEGWKALYGVREAPTDARSNEPDEVRQAARKMIKRPLIKVDIQVNSRIDWSLLGLGDIVRMSLPHHGWYGKGLVADIRIEGLELEEGRKTMRLIGKEWIY